MKKMGWYHHDEGTEEGRVDGKMNTAFDRAMQEEKETEELLGRFTFQQETTLNMQR